MWPRRQPDQPTERRPSRHLAGSTPADAGRAHQTPGEGAALQQEACPSERTRCSAACTRPSPTHAPDRIQRRRTRSGPAAKGQRPFAVRASSARDAAQPTPAPTSSRQSRPDNTTSRPQHAEPGYSDCSSASTSPLALVVELTTAVVLVVVTRPWELVVINLSNLLNGVEPPTGQTAATRTHGRRLDIRLLTPTSGGADRKHNPSDFLRRRACRFSRPRRRGEPQRGGPQGIHHGGFRLKCPIVTTHSDVA